MRISSRDFYLRLPPIQHSPGDIWSNIPIDILSDNHLVNAIVITPSCDLAQGKSEVANLIPLVPIREFIFMRPLYHEFYNSVKPILTSLGNSELTHRFSLPRKEDIESAIEILANDRKRSREKEKLEIYLCYLRYIGGDRDCVPDVSRLIKLDDLLNKIIRNSYRPDIHFLPKIEAKTSYTINEHSVALFRYVFSIDLDVLNMASCSSEEEWRAILDEGYPSSASKFPKMPIKICSLRDDFLTDFLARNLNMHLRFGSRDFDNSDIENIKGEIICTLE